MNIKLFHFLLCLNLVCHLSSQNLIQWYGGIDRDIINFSPIITTPKEPPSFVKMKYEEGIISSNRDEKVKGFLLGNGTTGLDQNGKIIFYTNGQRIFNSLGENMEGGDSLCIQFQDTFQVKYWAYVDTVNGASSRHPCQYIPYPGKVNEYLLFYTCDYYNTSIDIPYVLNYAHINMNFNNGLGKVISKENMLIRGNYSGQK